MADYNIEAVSTQINDYNGAYGPMKAYKVKLAGVDSPVEVSQKPETPAPKVGDVLKGTIDMSGQYGPKFKKDFAFTRNAGTPRAANYQPKDEAAIKAMWAIKTAALVIKEADPETIEALAKDLSAMVDRIKSTPVTAETVKDFFGDGSPVPQGPNPGFKGDDEIELPPDF